MSRVQLGVMLAFVLAAVVGVNAYAVRKSPRVERAYDALIVENKWDLATKGAPADGVVIVGDSSGNFGVDASQFAAAFGTGAINLCTFGRFLTVGPAWILDRALETAESPPSLVVVVLGSRTYAMEADGFVYGQIPSSYLDAQARAEGFRLDARESSEFMVQRLFPLFTESVSFSNAIRDRGSWRVDPALIPIESDGTTFLPEGRIAYGYDKDAIKKQAKKLKDQLKVEGPAPRVHDRRILEGMVERADAVGFDIVFVDGPVWMGLRDDPVYVALMDKVHTFLDELCSGSERAHRLPHSRIDFHESELENPFHISREAAGRFTQEIVDGVRAMGLPRPR